MAKTKHLFRVKILFLSIIFCLAFLPARANSDDQGLVINLKDVDIKVFVQQVADATGKTFILDDGVAGNVTVVSNKSLKKDEVYNLFLSTLKTKGLAVVPTAQGFIIMKDEMAKESSLRVGNDVSSSGEEIITKVIYLKNASAQELSQILRPIVARYGHIAASDFSNSLLVVDRASNVKKIEKLIARLDKEESTEMEVVKLKQAWVGNIAAVLKELDYGQALGGKQGNKFQSLRMVANEYDNSIILKGDKTEREIVKGIITKLDETGAGEGNLQVIYLNYAEAANVAEILKTLIASNRVPVPADSNNADAPVSFIAGANEQISIQPDKTLNALVVKADPQTINSIRGIVQKLDIKRPQVLIEAAIVEVSGELSDALGVQFGAGRDAATGLKFAATSFDNSGVGLVDILKDINAPAAAALSAGLTASAGSDRFNVLVQALSKNVNANLLSTPSITTLDNQAAEILVGQNVPFITGSYTNSTGDTNPFTTIERQDIGISLKVTPHIHQGDAVRMDVQQEVSSLVPTAQATAQASDLITNKRSIKTSILAQNKEIIVIGGLIQDDINESESKVPILGDIPLIGNFFTSTGKSSVKRNLFVFLHPTILYEKGDVAGATKHRLNKIYDLNLNEEINEINKEKWCRNFNDIFGSSEVMPEGCAPAKIDKSSVIKPATVPVSSDAPEVLPPPVAPVDLTITSPSSPADAPAAPAVAPVESQTQASPDKENGQ